MSRPLTRIVGELTKRNSRACSADRTWILRTLDLRAGGLQDTLDRCQGRVDVRAGALTALAGRSIQEQEVDRHGAAQSVVDGAAFTVLIMLLCVDTFHVTCPIDAGLRERTHISAAAP